MGTITNFGKKTRSRLSEYKAITFPDLADGFWREKSCPHILSKKDKYYNLLPTYKDELIEYISKNKIKLHMYFHHLSSSQAMCFNFFFPLYREQKLELITNFLGLTNETVNYNTVCFEKDGIEAKFGRTPTSFDFFFETTSCKKFHFEIKYTETEFGRANINGNFDKYLDKFNAVYSKLLEPLKSPFHSSQPFFENYQILRNVIHIDANSYVVFVYPQDNERVSRAVNRVKTEFLIPKYHNHFFATTWEKLFDNALTPSSNTNIKTQLTDFRKKYLPLT